MARSEKRPSWDQPLTSSHPQHYPIKSTHIPRRRLKRSCDACRRRKIKCDRAERHPCSACTTASLTCKTKAELILGDGAGYKKLLQLEAQVQELSTRLNNNSSNPIPQFAKKRQQTPNRLASVHDLAEEPWDLRHSHPLSVTDANMASELFGSKRHLHGLNRENPENLQLPASGRRMQVHHSNDVNNQYQFFGSTSGVVFTSAVKDLVRRLGYRINPVAPTSQNSLHSSESTSYIPQHQPAEVAYLLELLPPQQLAACLLDLFKIHIYDYAPGIDWPSVVNKFRRLYELPVSASDSAGFVKDFCLLNAVWGVGSQLSTDPELKYESGEYNRNGWRFFMLSRKYHDLMIPNYDLDDVAILLLQSVYLSCASLPSNCWTLVGLTARIIQDLGLHTNLRSDLFTPAEMEIRNRLFWCAYLVDRKIALSLGRTVALPDSDCNADLPQHTDIDSSVSSDSIKIFRVSIEVVSALQKIITFRPSGQHDQDKAYVSEIDGILSRCWEKYPLRMRDFCAQDAYGPSCLKVLCLLLQARLIAMRHFTDTTLSFEFRWWCFSRSVHVSTMTLAMVTTLVHTSCWQSKVVALCTDAVFSHVFRAAMVLLLANSPCAEVLGHPVQKHCVSTLWKFLFAVVGRHGSVRMYLHLLSTLAKTLGAEIDDQQPGQSLPPTRSYEQQSLVDSPHIASFRVPKVHGATDYFSTHTRGGQQNHSYESTIAQPGLASSSKNETRFPRASVPPFATHSELFPSPLSSWEWSGMEDDCQIAPKRTAQDSSVDWDLLNQIMKCDSSGFPFAVNGFENHI